MDYKNQLKTQWDANTPHSSVDKQLSNHPDFNNPLHPPNLLLGLLYSSVDPNRPLGMENMLSLQLSWLGSEWNAKKSARFEQIQQHSEYMSNLKRNGMHPQIHNDGYSHKEMNLIKLFTTMVVT